MSSSYSSISEISVKPATTARTCKHPDCLGYDETATKFCDYCAERLAIPTPKTEGTPPGEKKKTRKLTTKVQIANRREKLGLSPAADCLKCGRRDLSGLGECEDCRQAEFGKAQAYTYRRDDTGNAERLVRKFGDQIRFICETGEWMVWTSNGWIKDTNGKLMRMTKEVVREIADEAMAGDDIDKPLMDHSRKSAQRDRRKAMIELASSEKGVATNFADWDADKWLLNVKNGVIDLRTQAFRERKQTDLCMRQANVTYDPDAKSPLWDAALLKYMSGDQSMVDFLARYAGYSLTGDCDAQSLIFNMGDGSNGKDTFTSTVAHMMGSYAADAAFETFAESKNHSEHRNDLAVLAGAVRFLTSCEGSDGHSLDEGVIKRVTGQSPVTVRHIHGKPFTYFPEYKLWFSSNYEPAIKGQDIGIWRRVKRVPWDYTITEAEKIEGFGDLLKKEAPGILNWALRGLAEYVKAGKMTYHPKIDQATAQYRADMDIVGRFLRERCAMHPDATALGPNLYRAYVDWCRANGFYAANSRKFYGEFRRRLTGKVAERPTNAGAMFELCAMARSLSEEDRSRILVWLGKCMFRATDGATCLSSQLLPFTFPGVEHLPSGRMHRLDHRYDTQAVELLKSAGMPAQPTVEALASWLTEGLTTEECVGLLRYLGEDNRWKEYYQLRTYLTGPWFTHGTKLLTSADAIGCELVPSGLDPVFLAWLGVTSGGPEPASPVRRPVDAHAALQAIQEWWRDRRPEAERDYERRTYPEARPPELLLDFSDLQRNRSVHANWLTLFILGCLHTLGRTRPEQHKGFLQNCWDRGWFDVFADPKSSAERWIGILEDYSDEIETESYRPWMLQFVSIFTLSRHLPDYVFAFLEIERHSKMLPLDLITRSRTNPLYQGGGPDAPPAGRMLGIGACFVIRELVRLKVLKTKLAYPHCYVPHERVRGVLSHLGWESIDGPDASRHIYEFLVQHLGPEGATFEHCFDLPFQEIAEDPDLQERFFGGAISG